MNRRPFIWSLVVTVVVIGASLSYLATGARPNLGLDLQGGISAVYTPVVDGDVPGDISDILDQTIEVIRARVDSLGVAEPDISRQGNDVLIQLPGLDDTERAQEIIGKTAKLTFRPVVNVVAPGTEEYDAAGDCVPEGSELAANQGGVVCGKRTDLQFEGVEGQEELEALLQPLKYVVGPAVVTVGEGEAITLDGSHITNANPQLGQQGWEVSLDLDRDGGRAFATQTSNLACARDAGEPGLLAIVLDDVVESAPQMQQTIQCGVGITGGQATITVGGSTPEETQDQARDLALILRTGSLPITLQPSTFETVSPTLGRESLRTGLIAGLIGLGLVIIYLIGFYRWLGVVAIGALLIFGVLMLTMITLMGEIGFALTLAGIAGIIVAIGITADSSIIFFERIRDEVRLGKTVRTAVHRAFRSAFRTNLAGNTVTLTGAVILYFLAIGPVRGFALMLGIATIIDILILYAYSRAAVGLLGTTRYLTRDSLRVSERPTAVRSVS